MTSIIHFSNKVPTDCIFCIYNETNFTKEYSKLFKTLRFFIFNVKKCEDTIDGYLKNLERLYTFINLMLIFFPIFLVLATCTALVNLLPGPNFFPNVLENI